MKWIMVKSDVLNATKCTRYVLATESIINKPKYLINMQELGDVLCE